MSLKDIQEIPEGHVFESIYLSDPQVVDGYVEVFVKLNKTTFLWIEQSFGDDEWNWCETASPCGWEAVGQTTDIVDHGPVTVELRERIKKQCGYRV